MDGFREAVAQVGETDQLVPGAAVFLVVAGTSLIQSHVGVFLNCQLAGPSSILGVARNSLVGIN